MIGRGVESRSGGGSVFPFEGAREFGRKLRRRFRGGLGVDGVILVKQRGRQNRNGTSRPGRRVCVWARETGEQAVNAQGRKRGTGRDEKIFPPSDFRGSEKERERERYTRCGMRATFLLFIVSRCLCFTRPSRAALHDNAGKGGISEGTNNVMYYT